MRESALQNKSPEKRFIVPESCSDHFLCQLSRHLQMKRIMYFVLLKLGRKYGVVLNDLAFLDRDFFIGPINNRRLAPTHHDSS
jgi:hypothetical protein